MNLQHTLVSILASALLDERIPAPPSGSMRPAWLRGSALLWSGDRGTRDARLHPGATPEACPH